MYTAEDFDDEEVFIDDAAQHVAAGRFALVLGAGASAHFDLPDWDTLLSRMYGRRRRDKSLPVERQAEDLRIALNDEIGFVQRVRRALYRDVRLTPDTLASVPLLAAVSSLMVSAARGRVRTVVTFNFDDVLERYLEFHGLLTESFVSANHWSPRTDIAIFHPHGWIPADDSRRVEGPIVLDSRSFAVFNSSKFARERAEVLTIFHQHSPMLIGLSGTDSHLNDFLAEAASDHPSKIAGEPFWGYAFCKKTRAAKEFWSSRGIAACGVLDYDRDIPRIVFEIASRTAAIARTTLQSASPVDCDPDDTDWRA